MVLKNDAIVYKKGLYILNMNNVYNPIFYVHFFNLGIDKAHHQVHCFIRNHQRHPLSLMDWRRPLPTLRLLYKKSISYGK